MRYKSEYRKEKENEEKNDRFDTVVLIIINLIMFGSLISLIINLI